MIDTIYIHIPFCGKICTYCDFTKRVAKYADIDMYVDNLIKHIKSTTPTVSINSIYIGGGTPSLLTNEQFTRIIEAIKSTFNISDEYEFTVEFNPEDVKVEKIEHLKTIGVNRVSIGCQTIDSAILTEHNRSHDKETIITAIKNASIIDNVSVDFMFDWHSQTKQMLDDDLQFIFSNRDVIKNVSYYSLIIEDNSIIRDNEEVPQEVSYFNYRYIQKKLAEYGYVQYEISNYAKHGYASIHNRKYWDGKQYYGFGLGASGFEGNIRYTNTKSLKSYNNDYTKKCHLENLTKYDKIYDELFLGLRQTCGISKDYFDNYGLSINLKMLNVSTNRVSIKKEFLYISNDIIVDILIEFEEKNAKVLSK